MRDQPSNEHAVLARGEIERLCLLSAIPDGGCTPEELTTRLGLSPLLNAAVATALTPLVDNGLVERGDASVFRSHSGEQELRQRQLE